MYCYKYKYSLHKIYHRQKKPPDWDWELLGRPEQKSQLVYKLNILWVIFCNTLHISVPLQCLLNSLYNILEVSEITTLNLTLGKEYWIAHQILESFSVTFRQLDLIPRIHFFKLPYLYCLLCIYCHFQYIFISFTALPVYADILLTFSIILLVVVLWIIRKYHLQIYI